MVVTLESYQSKFKVDPAAISVGLAVVAFGLDAGKKKLDNGHRYKDYIRPYDDKGHTNIIYFEVITPHSGAPKGKFTLLPLSEVRSRDNFRLSSSMLKWTTTSFQGIEIHVSPEVKTLGTRIYQHNTEGEKVILRAAITTKKGAIVTLLDEE